MWNELKKIGGDFVEDHVDVDEEDENDAMESYIGEVVGKRKLKEKNMSCQQFMHLPEWLDIEIQPQRTIQVGASASCCQQFRYGGLMSCRKCRIMLSSPMYQLFITFLMVRLGLFLFLFLPVRC